MKDWYDGLELEMFIFNHHKANGEILRCLHHHAQNLKKAKKK